LDIPLCCTYYKVVIHHHQRNYGDCYNLMPVKDVRWKHAANTDKFLIFVAKKPYKRSQYFSSFMKLLLRLSLNNNNNNNNLF